MKLEKSVIVAIIALVLLAGAASGYYGYEIWKEHQPLKVEKGDFVEFYYIGYFENGSIFDSSFGSGDNITKDTSFDETNYSLTSMKGYIGDTPASKYPEGWDYSSLGRIEGRRVSQIKGLLEGMKGMGEGDEKIIGPIPPEEAYGLPVKKGVNFSSDFMGPNLKFMITDVDPENMTIDFKWMPEIGEKFTVPAYQWGSNTILFPYWLWENATEVISFNETNATLKTTPNELHGITLYPFWENATEASFNDTTITLVTNPKVGSNFTYYGYVYTVENVTDDKINVSVTYGNETQYVEIDKTLSFNRTFNVTRIFDDIPQDYLKEDLEANGYTFSSMAGKTVYFKVKLIKIYRV
jgi:FKBP-type peptidyl-prolyl cis-trans isomerase 2